MAIKSCLIKRKKQQAPVLTFGPTLKNSYSGSLRMFLLLMAMGIFFTACPENHIHRRDTTIHLNLVHAGTFAVRLKVSVEDSSDAWTFALTRNDSTVKTGRSDRPDTIVTDSGLLPGQTYRYRAYWLDDEEMTDSSEIVLATTMDTTSHNFVWEIDTLGDYGSYLNDVAVIDENDVWVVGYIKEGDSTYNAAHWKGSEWELNRLPAVTYGGAISQGALTSIHVISAENIWCSSDAGSYVHWNGQEWHSEWIPGRKGGINAIWGTSSANLYFVGNNGSIVHYDGSTFNRMESGTDIPIVDVWGGDENDIYFCQFNNTTGVSGILHYDGNQLENLYYFESITHNSDTLSGAIHTIWIYRDTLYAGCSSGIWKENIKQGKGKMTFWAKIFGENIYSNKIRGQSINDIFIVGNWMKMAHYNGVSWKSYANIFGNWGTYEAVDLKGNLVCAVGWTDFPKALIVVGKIVLD